VPLHVVGCITFDKKNLTHTLCRIPPKQKSWTLPSAQHSGTRALPSRDANRGVGQLTENINEQRKSWKALGQLCYLGLGDCRPRRCHLCFSYRKYVADSALRGVLPTNQRALRQPARRGLQNTPSCRHQESASFSPSSSGGFGTCGIAATGISILLVSTIAPFRASSCQDLHNI
jgi:hypothetical protein